jgi:hypothetical protein
VEHLNLYKVSKQIQLQGIGTLFMPLNKKTLKAHMHCNDLDGRGHWVGSHGDWMTLVTNKGLLKIRHMYRELTIDLPLLAHIGVLPAFRTCKFSYKQCELQLLKIQITKTPYMERGSDQWHYEAIMIFDKLIAYVEKPQDNDWVILKNYHLAPRRYVDACAIRRFGDRGELYHVYAVTEPRGDVLVW